MKKLSTILILISISVSTSFAQADFELRGPNRDGYYPNEKLLDKWPEEGPKLIKSIENIGAGYTLPAVTNDRIYVTGMKDSTGYLYSYDLAGNLLWEKAYGKEWTSHFPGTRSTPTVVKDKIYFTGPYGKIYCFDKSGKKIWTVDMVKEFGFRSIDYGANESVLIEGDKLYCTPGGEKVMIAILDKNTGKTLTTIEGNGQKSSHCSPVIVKHNNTKLLLTMMGKSLVGIDLDKNKMTFEHEIFNQWDVSPNTPIYKDGHILISIAQAGTRLLKIADDCKSVSEVWEIKEIDNENEGAILYNDHVFLSASSNKTFYCIEFATGKIKYMDKMKLGKANVVMADGKLYSYNFRGYVYLLNPNTEALDIISRVKVKNGTREHICHPVIKNGKMYIRHGEAFNIYDIKAI